MNDQTALKLEKATKFYHRGTETVHAVDNISLAIENGDYCTIVGPSGSGKTTLMNLMGCLDHPTSGKVWVNGKEIERADEKVLTRMRQTSIGFVFQQFFLIPTLTVLENVQLPSLFARKAATEHAKELLTLVGLANRLDHLPGQLSGGEMQRVAIARSLVNSPPIVLADEPTGNLDSRNAEMIMGLFDKLHESGMTIVVVTHNEHLAGKGGKTIAIEDGKITN
ncbi:MAG: ATP-binding cassette domain-containing protein [Chitinivibrionales bacterium]|nr:ATP-binding cassette domain-containing protein [Chitinivibrionales bacterium]MBD3394764.1 ATP-binding cassette domain-containing protein [Chitinivibrionales bacterium]